MIMLFREEKGLWIFVCIENALKQQEREKYTTYSVSILQHFQEMAWNKIQLTSPMETFIKN